MLHLEQPKLLSRRNPTIKRSLILLPPQGLRKEAMATGTMATTVTIGTTIAAGTMAITSNKEMEKVNQTILPQRKSLMEIVTIVAFKVIEKLIATKRKEMKNTKVMVM